MARGYQRHGSQECNSPWTQKSNGVSEVLGREPRYLIEIATDIYNSDCQRLTMQTLSTASAAATAIQQGSTKIHKLQEKYREDGKSRKAHEQNDTFQDKDGMKWQDC